VTVWLSSTAIAVMVSISTVAFAAPQFESSKLSPGIVVQGSGLESSKLSSGIVLQGAGMESPKLSAGLVLESLGFQSSKVSAGVVVETATGTGGIVSRAPLTHW
jgi:hypothetical protein